MNAFLSHRHHGSFFILQTQFPIMFNGLIAAMSILGSVDTNVFLYYVEHILIPQLWVGAIVVMDNLPVHHAHAVREAIEAVGAKLVFLPPILQTSRPLNYAGQNSSNSSVLRRPEPVKHSTKR